MEISAQIFTSILASTRSTASKDDLLLMTSTNPLDGFVHRTTLTTNVPPLTDERLNRIQKTNQVDEVDRVEDEVQVKLHLALTGVRSTTSIIAKSPYLREKDETRQRTVRNLSAERSQGCCSSGRGSLCSRAKPPGSTKLVICPIKPETMLINTIVRALQPSHLVGSI